MDHNLNQKQEQEAFAPRHTPTDNEMVIEMDHTHQNRPASTPLRRSVSAEQRASYPYDYPMEEDDITSVKMPSHRNSIDNTTNRDHQHANYAPFSIIITEHGRPSSIGDNDLLSSLISAPPQPKRSVTAPDGLTSQALGLDKDVRYLSEDHDDDDLNIKKSPSLSSLSESSSKTLIGKPRPSLYVNKTSPYCSVISGLSTPSKISHSNTHDYLSATEGVDSVAVDVKHEISDPDFDTSLQEKKRPVNKRGVCNLMTIVIILAIIVFMFAGYPLSLYISKQLHPTTSDTSTGLSSN
ncbi:hypothetical protein INT43_006979 [Umbelopsis isabellina]|uniref:Uncharacterized protein n=1 Tax=Mortierella isabellina TaxID=91625 RepID=A0A8H7PYB9_MORIS|nr:hypothetical protein INT43_006979 [Umbelopsis isabellina]